MGKGFDYIGGMVRPRIPRSVAIFGSKVGQGLCLFVGNVFAIDEERRALSTLESCYRLE